MEGLLKAASELLATILRALGYVGHTRRRAAISSDLELLRSLQATEGFGAGSHAHDALLRHIELEVDQYAGSRREWRKREWGTIAAVAILGAAFGYLTDILNDGGFAWYSVFPGLVALVMFITFASALFNPQATENTAAPVAESAADTATYT